MSPEKEVCTYQDVLFVLKLGRLGDTHISSSSVKVFSRFSEYLRGLQVGKSVHNTSMRGDTQVNRLCRLQDIVLLDELCTSAWACCVLQVQRTWQNGPKNAQVDTASADYEQPYIVHPRTRGYH